ncbi:MAG: hypothetical protein ACK5RD_12260, partial [Aphanizomenon sp.]
GNIEYFAMILKHKPYFLYLASFIRFFCLDCAISLHACFKNTWQIITDSIEWQSLLKTIKTN